MQSILITCKITALEDFHIGTGIGNIGLYDDGQLKDKDGIAMINASTFKGLLRDSCEQLNRIAALIGNKDYSSCFAQLFEHYDNLSSLDIQIEPVPKLENPTVIHYFTAVKHDKRRAKTNTLRSIEFGSKDQEFNLTLRYFCRNDAAQELADYLVMGIKNIKSMGGHRRRGFGAIAVTELVTEIHPITVGDHGKASSNKLDMILELSEDTILSSKAQSGNLLNSNDYIPGTTILGMLRSALLIQKYHAEYLDEDRIAASFFYPLPADDHFDFNTLVCPVLFSLRKKKQYQAPLQKESKLPPWAIRSKRGDRVIEIISQNTLFKQSEHADPGKGMYEGYIAADKHDINWTKARYYKVPKLYYQRNHISPAHQSTVEDGVFIEERIPKGTKLAGSIEFSSETDCAAFIRDFDSWLSKKSALHIGRGGKPILINKWQFSDNSESPAIIQASDDFTITLLSDAILYDSSLNALRTINTNCMKELLGEPWLTADIKLVAASSRSGIISSFSGTSGLRKFRELAIRKGSCYRFTVHGCDMEALLKRLATLEKQGIGFRKNEGFGRIAINHSLHKIKPSATPEPAIEPVICEAEIAASEQARLETKAANYYKANQLAQKLKKYAKEKWRSVVADLIVKFEAGVDYALIKQSLTDKMEPEVGSDHGDTDINGITATHSYWGKDDSRYKIAGIIIDAMDAQETPEVIAIALKLTFKS